MRPDQAIVKGVLGAKGMMLVAILWCILVTGYGR